MNTLSALIGWLASIWLTFWAFNTIAEDLLGYAFIGMDMLFIAIVYWAARQDLTAGKDEVED